MLRFLIVVSSSLVLAASANAQPFAFDPNTRDQVTFSVARQTTVENDEMTVTLAAIETDLDAAVAADAVNRTMQEVLPKLRAKEGVDFRTGSYTTSPYYLPSAPAQRPREQHWRVEQHLIVASRDFDAVRDLVSELQASLQLKAVGFTLSQEKRIEKEREMHAAALAAFREDAERIRTALGARAYEIVELQLSSGSHDPVQRQARYAGVAMAAEAGGLAAPVVLEGGDSEVTGSVQARIQLLR